MKVWKYVLPPLDAVDKSQYSFSIFMPKRSEILKIDKQKIRNGNVIEEKNVMWVLVDPNQPEEGRTFYSVGTGWGEVRNNSYNKYIGTIKEGYPYDKLVWHIFEAGRRSFP